MTTIELRPTAVYRLYDANDQLLYVGLSCNPEHRWNGHHRKDWWPQVARKAVTWHEDRPAAAAAERAAIADERPAHNVQHHPVRWPEALRRGLARANATRARNRRIQRFLGIENSWSVEASRAIFRVEVLTRPLPISAVMQHRP